MQSRTESQAAARGTDAPQAKRGGVSFDIKPAEFVLIGKLLDRCEREGITKKESRLDHAMDLTACHANGCPLDFEAMLAWPREFDLAHDIFGINRHIDRETGALLHCFLPRFAKGQA